MKRKNNRESINEIILKIEIESLEKELIEYKIKNHLLEESLDKIFKESKIAEENFNKMKDNINEILLEFTKNQIELKKYKIICDTFAKKYNFNLNEIINEII